MAAEFLIRRILLVFLLSELDYSSAFPSARSYAYPEAWQGVKKREERYGYGNRRPLQYIQALRQPHRKLQVNFHDQVQVRTWQKPQDSSLKVHGHAEIQNQPGLYHQTQRAYQPWSRVATKWTEEMSPSQHPQINHPLSNPRSFEFSLKVPFADLMGQNKETSSATKGSELNNGRSDGAGHDSQFYRPSSVQIHSSFNSGSGSDSFSDKGSTNYPNGGKTAQEVSKPSFQLNLSVPIPPPTPSSKPPSSTTTFLANPQRPGSVGFVQNSYMEPEKPQSSSAQSGSEWVFLNSYSTVQQQTEHQIYEPTRHTDSALITFSPEPEPDSQHTTPTEQISQGSIYSQQSLAFPESSAPSLPMLQYRPVQSDNVHSSYYNGYYGAQINPLSNDYGKGQSGQTVSPDPTNVDPSLSPSQYESVPSGYYSAGQVKPSGNNFNQHQTGQPVTPVEFASEQYNYDQFKPSVGQYVDTVPHLSPGSTNYPNGGKTGQEVSNPSFQLNLSVPIPPPTPSSKPPSSTATYLANPQRPGSVGYVQNHYMEPAKPQSSSAQSGSEWVFLNSDSTVQQQTEHQINEPTRHTDSTPISFSPEPEPDSQHTTPTEQISQGSIYSQQSLAFPEPSAPSLPMLQYPPVQSDNVYSSYYSGYYGAQINPLSNDYGKGQSGQTVSPDQTNVDLSLSPSQYESVPSGYYSSGQVKPSGNNFYQHQTGQPVTPAEFASEQYNYDQFKPSVGQNVDTVPHLSPGSTNYPNGGKTAQKVSKPSFQLNLFVPIPSLTPSSKPPSSTATYLANPQRPGSVGYVQNHYMEPAKPQSSSAQSGSEWVFLNSDSTVQQQTEHQINEPTRHTDSTPISFVPEPDSQQTTPTEQISQGSIYSQQSLAFPESSAPSLPMLQYPPVQSDNVHSSYYSGYYGAQINPLSNDYGKGQSGQTVSPDPTNVDPSLSPSQYESVPSGYYSTGQVKPSGNNFDQHQTRQPVTPVEFPSEQYNYDQFKPSVGQDVDTVPYLSPDPPSPPTAAQSQYELPSFHHGATSDYYGTGDVVQMGSTDFSSSYQYSRDQSEQDGFPDNRNVFDPSPNFQSLSNDYQTQMRLPGHSTGRGQLYGKPEYTKLFIDVDEDEMDGGDGQHNYFAAPPTDCDDYSGTQTEQNTAETSISNRNPLPETLQSQFSVGQDKLAELHKSTESYPSNKPYMPLYSQTLSMHGEVGQYASNPQKQMQRQQIQTPNPVPGQANYAPYM